MGVAAESGAWSADGLQNPVKVYEALAQGGELPRLPERRPGLVAVEPTHQWSDF